MRTTACGCIAIPSRRFDNECVRLIEHQAVDDYGGAGGESPSRVGVGGNRADVELTRLCEFLSSLRISQSGKAFLLT
jgi:hypothetical protein